MAGKRFAAIVAGLDKEYQREYITGLAETVRQTGDSLDVFACQGFPETASVINARAESRIFDLIDLSEYDGVCSLARTIPDSASAERINRMLSEKKDLPLVTLDVKEGRGTHINFDDATSMRAIMEHMITVHHCRTFALVRGPVDNEVADARNDACLEVIRSHGCEVVLEFDGRWTRDGGRRAAGEILKLEKLPDAVICCNDDAAIALTDELQRHNILVPQNVLVTGVDARHDAIYRGVTTMRRPVRHAGSLTGQYLTSGVCPDRRVVLDTEVVPGTSCGCRKSPHSMLLRGDDFSLEHADMELLHSIAFTSRMASCETPEQAGEVMLEFGRACGLKQFYVVLDPAVLTSADKQAENALPENLLLMAGFNGDETCLNVHFSRHELLPGLKERAGSTVLAFLPLYYQDRMLGYCALDLEMACSQSILPVTTLMDCALMELAQRSTIRVYVEALTRLTYHDPLTGLYNRRGFYSKAEEMFKQAAAEGKLFAMASIDMDGMKMINDHYGHLYGDEAIRRMGRCVTALGSRYGVLCSHISGDEFMAAAIVQSEEEGMRFSGLLEQETVRLNREEPWVTMIGASVGLFVSVPTEQDSLSDFVRFADNRMYENKRARKALALKMADSGQK